MRSVGCPRGFRIDEILEYGLDETIAVRKSEIEYHIRPQIHISVYYSMDFEEVDSGDSKIELVYYLYPQTNN